MQDTLSFSDMTYTRVPMADIESGYQSLIQRCETADEHEIVNIVTDLTELQSRYETMRSLNHVFYTIDTRDEEVKAEKTFLDENAPTVAEWDMALRRKLLDHPCKGAIEEEFGSLILSHMEVALQTFDPRIKDHLKKISQLEMQYVDLLTSAKFEIQGESCNLSGLQKFMNHAGRAIRHEAASKRFGFFAEHGDTLDTIYDKLVALRHSMAQELGFENYVSLGYKRMMRTDYGPEDVAVFREEVQKHIVPLAAKWRAEQAKRLDVGDSDGPLMFWDEALIDKRPSPNPRGDEEFILRQTEVMYSELSPETHAFFQVMKDRSLFDLSTKEGKAGGGYCTSFSDYGVPFIFSNFNGTKGDVEVMTHECGHAFQCYSSREQPLLEYRWPTMEACEIHSMGMEFLTYPWMKLFFEEDADRFCCIHMMESIIFLPYGCAVDEFQHFVYENPDCGAAARKQHWKTLEAKYLPWRHYGDLDYPNAGGFWQAQRHIYESPFYYIDYVLAQTCALQVWKKAEDDRETALRDYMAICKPGGSQTFLQLLETGKLKNPFQPGVLQDVVGRVQEWIAKKSSVLTD